MLSREDLPDVVRAGLDRADQALRSGLSFVQSSWNALPFFASVEAAPQVHGAARDETHYFLVPFKLDASGCALYTTRRIPAGYASTNDLPRVRVFHLPGPGAERTLEEAIVTQLARGAVVARPEGEEPLGARLERLADEIDRHGRWVTGGFLIVGGVAAIFNPLLGAGIAVKALFPSLGAALSREGLKHVGQKLRFWEQRREEAATTQAAQKEFERGGEVRSVVNPLLQALDRALRTSERQFDPLLEYDLDAFQLEGWDAWELLVLTSRAVTTVYRATLADPTMHGPACLGPEDVRWLELVARYAERTTPSA